MNGFNSFKAQGLLAERPKPKIMLSEISFFEENNDSLLTRTNNLQALKSITLPATDRYLQARFALDDLTHSELNRYEVFFGRLRPGMGTARCFGRGAVQQPAPWTVPPQNPRRQFQWPPLGKHPKPACLCGAIFLQNHLVFNDLPAYSRQPHCRLDLAIENGKKPLGGRGGKTYPAN